MFNSNPTRNTKTFSFIIHKNSLGLEFCDTTHENTSHNQTSFRVSLQSALEVLAIGSS